MTKFLAMCCAILGVWCFRAANRLDPMPDLNEMDVAALAEWIGLDER